MLDRDDVPDHIRNKLSAPVRKTAFERNKEEAEAKRRRDEAETAEVLKMFQEDHGVAAEDVPLPTIEAGFGNGGFLRQSMAPKHYGRGSSKISRPPDPPPPPTQSLRPPRKRQHTDEEDDVLSFYESNKKGKSASSEPMSRNGLRDASWQSSDNSKAQSRSDKQKVKVYDSEGNSDYSEPDPNEPKPVISVWNIPHDMENKMLTDTIDKLVPKEHETEDISLIVPINPNPTPGKRKTKFAEVRMARGTSTNELDNIARALNGKYVGWGHYIRASRKTLDGPDVANDAKSLYPFGAVIKHPGKGNGGYRGGDYGGNRGGGYGDNRGGGYGDNRESGYSNNRGPGYNDNRGGSHGNRGGSHGDNRGGNHGNRGGSYGDNRGGNHDNQGQGYNDNRGSGYDNNRGGGSRGGRGGPHGALHQNVSRGDGQPNYQNTSRRNSQDFSKVEVKVTPPTDLQQIRLIHETVENVLTHGVEFEALLMSHSDVQKQEKWAWIWDARSVGGVWYRYRLWELHARLRRPSDPYLRRRSVESSIQAIYNDGPSWVAPKDVLKFEFVTDISEFKHDPEFHESELDSEDDEDGRRRSFNKGKGPPPEDHLHPERDWLEPLAKAEFTWLLARLPTEITKLRNGDVARVTGFALKHVKRGKEEIVDMLILNVEKPFCFSAANTNPKATTEAHSRSTEPLPTNTDNPSSEPGQVKQYPMDAPSPVNQPTEPIDVSSAKRIGLTLILDLCLASSNYANPVHLNSWVYPSLIEEKLKSSKVFAHLGRLDRDLGWGKLRAQRWKAAIAETINSWKEHKIFTDPTYQAFKKQFENPPLTAREREEVQAAERARMAARRGKVEIRGTMAEESEDGEWSEGGRASAERRQKSVDYVEYAVPQKNPKLKKRKMTVW
ncbi:hypothetical protein BU16DRAFT_522828 [Lophium mytilinum]|uniref:SURP motif domain-containing protein n=1 Tax=Lophium mytilinum TaxID=390894 RepID=A0A6A6R886_9PEZI|nr:hypothetical protein BU16DRAFT_522828 [Lophium mytilinum]